MENWGITYGIISRDFMKIRYLPVKVEDAARRRSL